MATTTPARPLLPLAAPTVRTRVPLRQRGGGPKLPKKVRQVERLTPRFEALERVRESQRAALQTDATGATPEEVLVIETIGPVADFYAAVAQIEGLEWLAENEDREILPDEDFYHPKDHEKRLAGRVYLLMFNQAAIDQLLSLWGKWKQNKRLGMKPWSAMFRQLHDIRRWDVQDRLRETRVLDDWKERVDQGWETVPVEIELWFRSEQERTRAETKVRAAVAAAQGQCIAATILEPIAYHAVLAKLPIKAVEGMIAQSDVEVLRCGEVRLFRPVGQAGRERLAKDAASEAPTPTAPLALAPPVAILLDGLPLDGHQRLSGRLIIDDPKDWASTYPANKRQHGTAMASLILHGDLSADEKALPRRLYARPVMRPDAFEIERAPEDQLWLDLLHEAVRRAVVGHGEEPAAAPGACIVNCSFGDSYQPFDRSISPSARLLDWLAWEHSLLFVVSAGNHGDKLLRVPEDALGDQHTTEIATMRSRADDARLRRLLAPAEAINVVTVGALHEDASGPWSSQVDGDRLLVTTKGLPNPLTALGRGYRRAVKPDIFAPGGRTVFRRQTDGEDGEASFAPRHAPMVPPGQKVASPSGRPGDVAGVRHQAGTSNAAALTTRAAVLLHDMLDALPRDAGSHDALDRVPKALWLKALLCHSAAWSDDAWRVVEAALRTVQNGSTFRDHACAVLGYGAIVTDRVLACAPERATLIGGGEILPEQTHTFRLPIPIALHAHRAWRRLTITLAWFTPINPRQHAYRCTRLWFDAPVGAGANLLAVDRAQAHAKAVTRGTLQHEVLEGDGSALVIGQDAWIEIPVSAAVDATGHEGSVPYALAVTLEIAPGVDVRVYDEIRDRVQPRVPIATRAR